ncbi:chemotaxis protein CheD [Halodesulfurarchaeum formicicum]|uniref:Probable chemoreceptor glutamine deamidase CheD n=2 Tax=Halodesulfurarchaeum formicicum TaxID=1873524 RepID=A0A1J1ADP8_9EURY|nr:chemotaxis protein CheD [Halodesulfurarchaeum formicicum]APE95888.1 chemotaxis protein CheD [Halodesulfurarchaeum formicicum]
MQTRGERIRVGVADMAVTDEPRLIVTSGLGSCVAVAIHDGDGIGGLLHAMLPTVPAADEPTPKYVDSGIELLTAELAALGAGPEELTAKLTGGSSMLDIGSDEPIGDTNVSAARTALTEAGIDLAAEETGGSSGRSVSFHPATGALTIERVDAETTVL